MEALQQAIRHMLLEHPEYGTPEGAEGRCLEACCDFAEICDDLGLDVKARYPHAGWDVIKVLGIGHTYRVDFSRFKEHYVLRCGDVVIDWTARQLNPKLEFPVVRQFSDVVLDPTDD